MKKLRERKREMKEEDEGGTRRIKEVKELGNRRTLEEIFLND